MNHVQQTLRYAVVSGACVLLNVVSISLLSWSGLHYSLATAISFCLVAATGFSLHSLWTFQARYDCASFVRYVSTIAINLPLAVALIGIAHDIVGLSVPIASAIASALLVVWNFVAARWALMRPAAGAKP